MADTWITPSRKKDLLGYIDQLKKLSGGPVEEEDLYAAGFSENDLEDIGWFTPQEKAPMMAGDGSKLEAYTPTSRDNVRTNVMGGLQGLGLDKQLARSVAVKVAGEENPAGGGLGMGLADFTPLGALFGTEEGVNTVKRGVNSGDYTSAGLGALNAATSVASALPGGKAISQGVNKLAEKLAGQYDPSVVRTFFGPTSIKADVGKLRKAEQLAASGADEQTVWRETGWWNGPNGWRFEVDDSSLKIPENSTKQAVSGYTPDVVDHDEFYKALKPNPDLSEEEFPTGDFFEHQSRNTDVVRGETTLGPMDPGKPYKGQFDPNDNSMKAYGYTPEDQKETLVHEMQHAIQSVFGDIGKGTNPEWISKRFSQTLNELPSDLRAAATSSTELGFSKVRMKEIDNALSDLETKMAKETAVNEDAVASSVSSREEVWPKGWDKVDNTASDKEALEALLQEKDFLERSITSKTKIFESYTRSYPDFAQAMSEFETVGQITGAQWFATTPNLAQDLFTKTRMMDPTTGGLTDYAAHTLYRLDAGEVEARIAGSRAGYSAEDRAFYPPEGDVVNKDSIYTADQLINWFSGVKDDAKKAKGYAKGGVVQETDPISGNAVPPGAEPAEVRDDIDAKLSDGEYIIPADVVRYIGLDKIEKLIAQAKEGLADMDKNGRIGGEDIVEEDDLPFTDDELAEVLPDNEAAEGEAPVKMATGGLVSAGDRIRAGVGSLGTKPVDPNLPPWMSDAGQPTQPILPMGVQERGIERKDRPAMTGIAGPVDGWAAKDFTNAVKQRANPAVGLMESKLSGMLPFGRTLLGIRHNYLDKKVPGAIDAMIKAGVDENGTPLTPEQITDLQKAKVDFSATKGYKPGAKGIIGSMLSGPKAEERKKAREEARVKREEERKASEKAKEKSKSEASKAGASKEGSSKGGNSSKSSRDDKSNR